MHRLIEDTGFLLLRKLWITSDVKLGRDEEKWMNMILKKKELY